MKEGQQDPKGRHDELIKLLDDYMRATKPSERRRLEQKIAGGLTGTTFPTPSGAIAEAVRRMPEGRYQAAGFVLWVDPELASSNLTERSVKAAELFGQAPDTFRRKDGGRPQVVEELADQIMLMIGEHDERQSSTTGDPTRLADSKQASQQSRRWIQAAAIFGILAVAAIGIAAGIWERLTGQPASDEEVVAVPLLEGEVDVTLHCETAHGASWTATPDPSSDTGWLCLSPDDRSPVPADLDAACADQYGDSSEARNGGSAATWTCVLPASEGISDADCAVAAGAYDSSRAEEFSPFAGPFRSRYEEAGGREMLGCPINVMHRWSSGMMQEIGADSNSTAGLLALEGQPVILLEGPSWSAFDRIKGISGTFVGYPKNEPYLSDDNIWVADLTPGGALVAQKAEGPYFWLPPIVFQYWRGLGGQESCLGFPITDPFSNGNIFRQDFESGQVVVDPSSASFDTQGDQC